MNIEECRAYLVDILYIAANLNLSTDAILTVEIDPSYFKYRLAARSVNRYQFTIQHGQGGVIKAAIAGVTESNWKWGELKTYDTIDDAVVYINKTIAEIKMNEVLDK